MASAAALRRWEMAAVAAILLLALGLRLYHLDAQSLWNDEGTSVALAQRDLATIARHASYDIHPPLYYYLLHGWIALAGTSEVAVRSLSVVAGVGLVAGVWALGRRLLGVATGVLAALLAAVAPFQVYYAQEARMYIWAALFGLLATLAFTGLVDAGEGAGARRRTAWAVAYVLAASATIYSHYVGGTVLVALNLAYLALWAWRRRAGSLAPHTGPDPGRGAAWRALGGWALLQALVVLAYVPWLAVSWRSLRNWPAVGAGFSVAAMLADALRVLAWGPAGGATTTAVAVAALALAGVVCAWRGDVRTGVKVPRYARDDEGGVRDADAGVVGGGAPGRVRATVINRCVRGEGAGPSIGSTEDGVDGRGQSTSPHWFGALVPALYLVTPIALMALASLGRPMYKTKFVLLAAPPFGLLVAAGVVGAGWWGARLSHRSVPGVVIALLLALGTLAPAAQGLARVYWDPSTYRDDYRGLATYITATSGPDDAILINAPSQIETFGYYYPGPLPIYPLPRQRPIDPEATRAELEALATRHDRIYAVLWATNESDPERIIEGWLDGHAYKALDRWYGNVRLAMWALPRSTEGAVIVPAGHVLGQRVRLAGYSVLTPDAAAGDVLQVALHWEALVPIPARYKVFVHLVDGTGTIVAQRDSEPGGGARLTSDWRPGEKVADLYGLLIPPGTPPGECTLRVGMYGLDDDQRLTVALDGQPMGDAIDLVRVTIGEGE